MTTNPWTQIAVPTQEFKARRIDSSHALDLFWARNQEGDYLFIYSFEDYADYKEISFPELTGIDIFVYQADNKHHLTLRLKQQTDWEIFLSLCNDIFWATRNLATAAEATDAIIRRLASWQEFLKRERWNLLPEEKIKGLLGELIFLKDYLVPRFGIDSAVQFWQGPEGTPQDFSVNRTAVEVKCKSGTTHPTIHISSADQLHTQLPELYLFVITLGKSDSDNKDAVSLPLIIGHIREMLHHAGSGTAERFHALLYSTGYTDSEKYLKHCYLRIHDDMFEVKEDFPRITPEIIPSGIPKLSYSVSISECQPFAKWPEWIERTT